MSRKKETSAIHNEHENDLQKLLEVLCYTNDVQIKIKVLSSMAGYLLSKQATCKIIVTHQPLYEELQYLLGQNLSLSNITAALNFIAALLCFDDVKGLEGSLKMHAQNALRTSGCLATLIELFSRDMMYQDLWIALCRSVAETCRGFELNQSYCSFLVPVCIRKCLQGNMESCLVLQSLLQNHDRNVTVFLDCDGVSIFTRNALQYDACLQLLDTVSQRSQRAATTLRNTDLVYHLREYLNLYGPDSKIGQWATIILYHIDSWLIKDDVKSNKNGKANVTEINDNNLDENAQANISINVTNTAVKTIGNILNKHHLNETKEVSQNVLREIAYNKLQKYSKNNTMRNGDQKSFITNASSRDNDDDTQELMQNIAREMAYENILSKRNVANKQYKINSQKDFALGNCSNRTRNGGGNTYENLQISIKNPVSTETKTYKNSQKMARAPQKNIFTFTKSFVTDCGNTFDMRKSEDSEDSNHLSFSFLLNEDDKIEQRRAASKPDSDHNDFVVQPTLTTRQFSHNYYKAKKHCDGTTSDTFKSFNSVTNYDKSSTVNNHFFKPTFHSTPKHITGKRIFTSQSRVPSKIEQSSRTSFKRSKSYVVSSIKSPRYVQPDRTEKQANISTATSINKRQSMSTRLFTAINESCTTFVKSVKGMFKRSANDTKNEHKRNDKDVNDTLMCSFSFTNYMQKRDAALANNIDVSKYAETEYVSSMNVTDSLNMNCKTCNETTLLQQKLKNDEYLRATIKKLKYGINLYGCDFKKISKALWPRDKFMTQRVLYILYRKLLAKRTPDI